MANVKIKQPIKYTVLFWFAHRFGYEVSINKSGLYGKKFYMEIWKS
jgi:hypothetical protein